MTQTTDAIRALLDSSRQLGAEFDRLTAAGQWQDADLILAALRVNSRTLADTMEA